MWKINGEKGREKNCATAEIQVKKKRERENRSTLSKKIYNESYIFTRLFPDIIIYPFILSLSLSYFFYTSIFKKNVEYNYYFPNVSTIETQCETASQRWEWFQLFKPGMKCSKVPRPLSLFFTEIENFFFKKGEKNDGKFSRSSWPFNQIRWNSNITKNRWLNIRNVFSEGAREGSMGDHGLWGWPLDSIRISDYAFNFGRKRRYRVGINSSG